MQTLEIAGPRRSFKTTTLCSIAYATALMKPGHCIDFYEPYFFNIDYVINIMTEWAKRDGRLAQCVNRKQLILDNNSVIRFFTKPIHTRGLSLSKEIFVDDSQEFDMEELLKYYPVKNFHLTKTVTTGDLI